MLGAIPRTAFGLLVLLLLAGCQRPWNNPYPGAAAAANTLFRAFTERPRHLDPARAYSTDESVFTGAIYEPPLQYAYLKRPYQLEPLTAAAMPTLQYQDKNGQPLPPDAPPDQIAYSVYTIHIRPGIRYQPHPAFARDGAGHYRYLDLKPGTLDRRHVEHLSDFPGTGTKELTAQDYVYEIKRLADPTVQSPIFSAMSEHIVGMQAYAKTLTAARRALDAKAGAGAWLDLRKYPLAGAKVLSRYRYQIKLHGRYPQIRYWLAMPFFAPVPWQVDRFYAQPGMAARDLTLDWHPVGTGPYMLVENNPNLRMVLLQNPNFHVEYYPSTGTPAQRQQGLLADAGERLPFIHRIVFSLEKESIPYWNKFLQGYYDISGISSESFDQAIHIGGGGEAGLTPAMKQHGIYLEKVTEPAIFYLGFNMLDPVVGGDGMQARKLRQAISIAVNYKDFISIFLNGRGIPAQSPLPPGIYGHQNGCAGLDHYVYTCKDGKLERKPIAAARRLLTEAGYPGGVDARTGEPLTLYLDTVATGPGDQARVAWYRKQFAKLDIQLVVRSTTYNRFQQKMANGDDQIFLWGWQADYPDPENFLFLLYGPNGAAKYHGANEANYASAEFDRLFDRMKAMANGPERQAIVQRMVALVQRDAPWAWGFYPRQFTLFHGWVHNAVLNPMANNSLKYLRLDPDRRAARQRRWNQPLLWPLALILGALVLLVLPAGVLFWRREHARPRPLTR